MTSTEHTTTAANVRAGDVITWVAPASPTSWAMDYVRGTVVVSVGDDPENPGRVLIRGVADVVQSSLRLAPDHAVRVLREDAPAVTQDRHSIPTKVYDMTVGAHVTIPTVHSGAFTGVLVARRTLGRYAAAGDVMVTIQNDDSTQIEVRTNENFSGWVNGSLAEQTISIPVAALRPGHVLVDHDNARHLVQRVRVRDGVFVVDARDTTDGTPDRDIPFGPDATVRVVVPAP